MVQSLSDIPNFVGIDFGTSRCAVTRIDRETGRPVIIKSFEDEETVPSVVYYGEDEVLVGTPAAEIMEEQDAAARARVICSIKRLIARDIHIPVGDRRVTPMDVAADILGKLRRDAEEGYFHDAPLTHAVVTVPATFTSTERERIAEAARRAGFTEVALLEEPVSAAIAYAAEGFEVSQHLLVYDLGAGTFDLALLARGQENDSFGLAMEPDGRRVGGDDFDQALYDYCDGLVFADLGRHVISGPSRDLRFLSECRKRKVNLSSRERCVFSSMLDAEEGGQPITFRYELTRAAFEDLVRPIVEDTVRQTTAFFDRACEQECRPDTVVLIGGSSRVPLIKSSLEKSLPVRTHYWERGILAVALGAAYHANALWGIHKSPEERVAEAIALAQEYGARGDYRAALETLTVAEALQTSGEQVRLARTELERGLQTDSATRTSELLDSGRISEAQAALDGLLNILPSATTSARVCELTSVFETARQVQSDFSAARDALEQGEPEAALKLLTRVLRRGKYVDKEAVVQLRAEVNAALSQSRVQRLLRDSRTCSEQDDHEAAWSKLDEAFQLAPDSPEVAQERSVLEDATVSSLLSLGFDALEAEDYDQARQHLVRLLRLCPATAGAAETAALGDSIERGQAVSGALKAAARHLDGGSPQAAMDALQTVLRQHPQAADAGPVLQMLAAIRAATARALLSALVSEADGLVQCSDCSRAWEIAQQIRAECTGDEATAEVDRIRASIAAAYCQQAEALLVQGDISAATGTLAGMLGVCPEAAETSHAGAAQATVERALEAEELLVLAQAALSRRDWGAAQQAASRALESFPKSANALWCRALSARGMAEHEEALQYLDRALALVPGHVGALRTKIEVLLDLGRGEHALPAVEQLLACDETDARSWVLKGRLLREIGRPKEAVVAVDQALKLAPSDLEVWLCRGLCCEDGRSLDNALASYERALQASPDSVEAQIAKGRVLVALGRADEGLGTLDQVIAADPASEHGLTTKAAALVALGRAQDALACTSLVIERNPLSCEAFGVQAQALLAMGLPDQALEVADQALRLDPAHAAALACRATALQSLTRPRDALEAADHAVSLAPFSPQAWEARALVLDAQEAPVEKRLACWSKVVELDKRRAEALKQMGYLIISVSCEQTGDQAREKLDKAERALARATALAPQDAQAWLLRTLVVRMSGRPEEAMEHCDRAVKLAPNEAIVLNLKGLCLCDLGREQESIRYYDAALRADGSLWAAYENKGAALLVLGKHKEALQCFEAALGGDPDSAEAWLGKGLALRNLHRARDAAAALARAAALNPAYASDDTGTGAACPNCKSTDTVREATGLGRKAAGALAGGVAVAVVGGVLGAITSGLAIPVAAGGAYYSAYHAVAGTRWRCRKCGSIFRG
jgi:tetratricopeptide (TPR) repeat protein